MLGDAEAEAAGVGEVLLLQLELLDLQASLEDLVGLEATDLQHVTRIDLDIGDQRFNRIMKRIIEINKYLTWGKSV